MPYKRKADRNRNQRKLLRGYRKAQAEYVRGVEAKVLSLEASNALLVAMLARQEETGYSWAHEQEQDKRILQLEAEVARIEAMMTAPEEVL